MSALRLDLVRERDLSSELSAAVRVERDKCLGWMERHNAERDRAHLLSAENEQMHRQAQVRSSALQ